MNTAAIIFEQTMEWLQNNYGIYHEERNIVLLIRDHLNKAFSEQNQPYKALDEFRMPNGKRADIVILRLDSSEVEVAVEFKYEPSHTRQSEFSPGAFPVTSWGEIVNDVSKVDRYVADGYACVAYAILVDEGRLYHDNHQVPPPQSNWKDWEASPHHPYAISLLWTRILTDATAS
jgi:hypothetical protein